MTENIENIENIEKPITIESKGQRDLILQELRIRKENQQLRKDNQLLSDELTYFKEHCADLEDQVAALKKQYDDFYEKEYIKRIDECTKLWGELFDIKHMSVWEFANKYCNEKQLEEAGHEFARSLLGHRMTDDELAIESAENGYKPYSGDDF